MRVIAPSADVKIPLRSGARLDIKKGEYYVFAERFVLELTQAFSESIIGSEISMESLYVPYRGQDLHEKTLFCFRTSGIGDFLAVTTALRALKEKFPTVKIIAGSFETNRYLAESDPCIDEFVTVPYPAKYLQESDYVLQFQGIIENITQESKESNFYDIFIKHSYIEDENFSVKNNLPKVFFSEKSEKKISSLFKRHGIKKPSVGIQVTTSSIIRNYPIPLLQRLIFLLTNALKLNVILIGAPSESPNIIIRNNLSDNEKSFDFAQYSNSVADFISIVNHCDFIISPDTAALHIAGALEKPMIGLFGPIRSNLRISNFKNAIGLDSETICTPCFRHGNTPCRHALENGDSPCMYIIEPERIIETVQNDILPLFGFEKPKQVEQEAVDDPDFDEDAKKAIVTLAIGDQAKEMLEIAKPFFQKYAKKTNSDFIVIDQEKIKVKFPNMEKFQMKEFLDKYDRIIYFDVDILIHPDCPDLFKIVPTKSVGFVPDSPDAKWNNLSRYRDMAIAQDALGDIGWTSGYFNSGVIVFSKEHKGLFDDPEARERMNCQYRDQTLINYNFQKNKYTPFILDKIFNGMEIVGFSSRMNPQNKTNAMVMHFAHEGDVLQQMKEIAKLFDFQKDNDERQSKPIMFYDSGELGWSMYLAAHINYLIEKRVYDAITVCAPKARHVLYKDIKNVVVLDIPEEIKEKVKGLDQDGTHLYDHKTKQRVKNDVLHKIFQDYFKNYNVSQRFGFFNGERIFFKYKATERAKSNVTQILKNKRAILIFPRNRIGKFGKRNLSKEFYIELCNKLCSEYPKYNIISIGSNDGAYHLDDDITNENFIDLVEWNDDETIDMLIALCNSKKVDFCIGSQSSLPKISLLLGIPTYMIGHEKERHMKIENWSNTLVGFTEVKGDEYDKINVSDCIDSIITFISENKCLHFEELNDELENTSKQVKEYYSDKPIFFYDVGELGWSMYLAAYIRKFRVNNEWKKIIVSTSPSKFVIYRDICDELMNIPVKIQNLIEGFEPEQHFLIKADDKSKRVPSVRLINVYKEIFEDYEIFEQYDEIREIEKQYFRPYIASEEARDIINKKVENEKSSILIFPRKRPGIYSNRNLSIKFWRNLIPKLIDYFSEYKIISIGASESSYNLSDEFENIIDFVSFDDEKTIDILVAACNLNKVLFSIGPQSGPSKIALLCGVPAFMIGHEHDRHVKIENWSKILVEFFDAKKSENGYLFDEENCINNIISFGSKVKLSKWRD